MNAYLIFLLILVIGFSVVHVPYGYSLNSNSSSSIYYEKNCRNDACIITTCENGQSCHTSSSENITTNTTQPQLADKGSFETKNLEFKNFWENFLNFNK